MQAHCEHAARTCKKVRKPAKTCGDLHKLAETSIFFLIGATSSKLCIESNIINIADDHISASLCSDVAKRKLCTSRGGKCVNDEIPFHFIVMLSPILSYLWLVVARQRIVRLQDVGLAKWSAK